MGLGFVVDSVIMFGTQVRVYRPFLNYMGVFLLS